MSNPKPLAVIKCWTRTNSPIELNDTCDSVHIVLIVVTFCTLSDCFDLRGRTSRAYGSIERFERLEIHRVNLYGNVRVAILHMVW